ncbi:MAG TPA: TlyA family RNA methyltransferase [Bryobacteraceae bacterium]|nr:TlyA family RNA methyltransferase [Bryobacteraceae bacterium]
MKSPAKKPPKTRLDHLLVERGLAASREKAQAMILAGQVTVAGQRLEKPGHGVANDASIEVRERMPYVSRGGYKLAGALDAFQIDVAGRVCLDVGASTGGFTDCLLQRGAAKVWAIDAGHGQLDWKLRNDPRVVAREGVNARYLDAEDYPERFDLAVCDASFISATMLIPAIAPLLKPSGKMIILVKPQFEAGRGQVGKGGIVKEPELHQAACDRVRRAVETLGFRAQIVESPIRGAEGNREFLLYAAR